MAIKKQKKKNSEIGTEAGYATNQFNIWADDQMKSPSKPTTFDKKYRKLTSDEGIWLVCYYNYYGITFNYKRLKTFYLEIVRTLVKWLNRRGGSGRTWEYYTKVLNEYCVVLKPMIYHSKLKAKP